MKKTYNFLLIALVLAFTGCDKSTQQNDILSGYYLLQLNIIYPENSFGNFYAEYNGQNISNTYFTREEKVGELKIYPKDSETPELIIEDFNIEENGQNIQLIKLPGKAIELYNESNYITFSVTLSLFEDYYASLNGQQIVNGLNYLMKDDNNGNIEFKKVGESELISSIENVNLSEGDNIIILQSSEQDFVQLTGGTEEEPEPEGDHLSKVRFFYAPIGELNVDSIRLDFIAFDMDLYDILMDYNSVVIKKGELSPYIELDASLFKENYASFAIFGYSVYNADSGELMEDAMNGSNTFEIFRSDSDSSERYYQASYKFTTYQITNSIGYPSRVVEGLSEKWETETPAE